MIGHQSVVSSLVISNGVLYSGSWDGTVRLWSLDDHNPLAILGEDHPGTLSSVLFLAADDNMLAVAHESGTIKVICLVMEFDSLHWHCYYYLLHLVLCG